jgi:hypothetical protein
MNTHTTTTFDASKLSARDRKNYESGLAIISRKLARARLAEIALKAVPTSYRIVPGATVREFAARPALKRSGGTRRHVVFSTLLAP